MEIYSCRRNPMATPVFCFSTPWAYSTSYQVTLEFLHAWPLSWFQLDYKVLHYPGTCWGTEHISSGFSELPSVFLVVLLQTAPGNIVPDSHIRVWCSHCVFNSHSELKKGFSSQDMSEIVTFPGLPQKPFHPTMYLRAPYMLAVEWRWGTTVLFHRPQGQCYLVWWLPPGLRGGERKRFLSEENLVSATTLGAHSLWYRERCIIYL